MGQRTEGSSDGENIAKNLIETIVNDVWTSVTKRTAESCESFDILKLQSVVKDECVVASAERMLSEEFLPNLSDMRYPSLEEVIIHSSTVSSSSQQGEGDHHPQRLREAIPFLHLQPQPGSTSSVDTDSSIIENLHRSIYELSFDDVHMSDSVSDDGSQVPNYVFPESMASTSRVEKDCAGLTQEQTLRMEDVSDVHLEEQRVLKHSQKFFSFNNKQFFPTEPVSYGTPSDEDNDRYLTGTKEHEDEQELLLSVSSEEIAIVDGSKDSLQTNPFVDHRLSYQPSLMDVSQKYIPITSTNSESSVETNRSKADVGNVKGASNWEEAVEVQVNVTEPTKDLETPDSEEEDPTILSKTYWSNVGLITENRVLGPRYLGPSESGIETVPNMTRVEEKTLTRGAFWTEAAQTDRGSDQRDVRTDERGNYLSFSKKSGKEKRKNKLFSRLTSVLSGIFRSKKKDFNRVESNV